MLVPKILFQLPSGEAISCEEIFSPFEIYSCIKHADVFILIPKPEQKSLDGIVIIGNATNIRICHNRWPKFVTRIRVIVNCKSNFIKIDYTRIPTDIQHFIASKLIEKITYQSDRADKKNH